MEAKEDGPRKKGRTKCLGYEVNFNIKTELYSARRMNNLTFAPSRCKIYLTGSAFQL